MTASRFGRLVLPSLAFAAASFTLAPGADARSRLLDDSTEVIAREAPDAGYGPAPRRQEDRR
jgi:hypothetical protein